MATTTITPGSWQTVATTTGDTAFQNQSQREVYILTGSTAGAGLKEGFLLRPWDAIVIVAGTSVSASAFTGDAKIFYMGV